MSRGDRRQTSFVSKRIEFSSWKGWPAPGVRARYDRASGSCNRRSAGRLHEACTGEWRGTNCTPTGRHPDSRAIQIARYYCTGVTDPTSRSSRLRFHPCCARFDAAPGCFDHSERIVEGCQHERSRRACAGSSGDLNNLIKLFSRRLANALGLLMGTMQYVDVTSSSIRALGYDESQLLMRMKFQDGEVYDYTGVSSIAYVQLLAAPSIGQHFNAHIREGPYECRYVGRANH